MMTTISDNSFSDDAHNVRKRSEIDCMLCFSLIFIWVGQLFHYPENRTFVVMTKDFVVN